MKVNLPRKQKESNSNTTPFQAALDREVSAWILDASHSEPNSTCDSESFHSGGSTSFGVDSLDSDGSKRSSQGSFSEHVPRGILRKTGATTSGTNHRHDVFKSPPGLSSLHADALATNGVWAMAQHEHGCKMLIDRWTLLDSRGREAMLDVLLPLLPQFSCRPFAHFVVEALLVTGDRWQYQQIVERLSPEAASLSRDAYGSRVIVQALRLGDGHDLISERLTEHIVECSKDFFGCYVVQRLLEVLPPSSLEVVVRTICECGVKCLSRCKYSSNVLQHLLRTCSTEILTPILDDLQRCGYDLLGDCHGSVLLQVVLSCGRIEDKVKICKDVLCHDVVSLRKSRYASTVVDHCVFLLGHADTQELRGLWTDLCASVTSSDWAVPEHARAARVKAVKECHKLMLKSSVGAQRKELNRFLQGQH